MGILFRGLDDDPKNLEEVIGQAIGAASVCWEHMEGTGIFLDHRASEIMDEVIVWLRKEYLKPNLGLATSTEMLQELIARAEVHGWGEYRSFDGR